MMFSSDSLDSLECICSSMYQTAENFTWWQRKPQKSHCQKKIGVHQPKTPLAAKKKKGLERSSSHVPANMLIYTFDTKTKNLIYSFFLSIYIFIYRINSVKALRAAEKPQNGCASHESFRTFHKGFSYQVRDGPKWMAVDWVGDIKRKEKNLIQKHPAIVFK